MKPVLCQPKHFTSSEEKFATETRKSNGMKRSSRNLTKKRPCYSEILTWVRDRDTSSPVLIMYSSVGTNMGLVGASRGYHR